MRLLAQILLVYNWGIICILLFFLLGIARFFEQRLSEKNTGQAQVTRLFPLFVVPIVLYATSMLLYLFGPPLAVGLFWADALRIVGTIVFIYAGYHLVSTMVGGRS